MLLKLLFSSLLLGNSLAALIPFEVSSDGKQCDCSGPNIHKNESLVDEYICGDIRLGPKGLPNKLPLATIVTGYDRFGGLTPNQFLKKWWNATKRLDGNETGWIYPEKYGFEQNEDFLPIKANIDLQPGTLVDRFGESTGRYISPVTAPFAQRALHPQNLNTGKDKEFPSNYHVYNVTRTFTVQAGPIRPWFGQPGFGVQFFLGTGISVEDYLLNGHLKELNASDLIKPGPRCGYEGEADPTMGEL